MNKIDYCYRYFLSFLGSIYQKTGLGKQDKLKIVGIYATSDIRHCQFEKNFVWDINHTVFSDAMKASKTELTVIWGIPKGYAGDYPYLYLAGNNLSNMQSSGVIDNRTIKGYITFDENDNYTITE